MGVFLFSKITVACFSRFQFLEKVYIDKIMSKSKSLKVYTCVYCADVEVGTSTPKIRGCKKSSFHHWVYLGEKGLDKYVCQNCGIKVNIYGMPSQEGCTGGKTHNWNKI